MLSIKSLFLSHLAQTTKAPLMLHITHAKGVYLYDNNGRSYLDLISGISVSTLGHGNTEVIKAIQTQSELYLHLMVYGEFIQNPQVKLAEKLVKHLPFGKDGSVYFTNSGSEAIEGAMKLAKRVTGKSDFVALENAYHGSTHGAISLSADPYYTNAYRPLLPGIKRMRLNSWEDLALINKYTAAVVIETIMGEAGYLVPEKEWIQKVSEICKENCALLISDEIQCGMGRTGSLFAFEDFEIIPDIIVLAKAFGAGMPLGCFTAPKKLMDTLSENPILGHITTFGGHPVSCAAALAGFDFLIQHKLWERALVLEQIFRKNLTHPAFAEISGKGMMLGIDLKTQEKCFKLVSACVENGLITDWFLYAPHKLRLAPPLILSDKEALLACDILNKLAYEIEL